MATTSSAPVRRATTPSRVVAVTDGHGVERPDRLVTEEPMEIRAAGPGQDARSVVVTMRTPGHDFELAAGFLTSEGLTAPGAIASIRYCELAEDVEQRYNIVTVRLAHPFTAPGAGERFLSNSSCGLCGKTSLDEVSRHCAEVAAGPVVPWARIGGLPDALRRHQRLFDQTGGLHAAGLFDVDGRMVAVREDVGRHNAVDKIVGWAHLGGHLPLSDRILVVSGRLGFEIVQKAAAAGIPVIVAVSAPSSLAVDAARRFGVTVVGFVRGERGNIYCGAERVRLDD
jgi:FdhD protein